jgi:RND family efflux transporter MFP subunit
MSLKSMARPSLTLILTAAAMLISIAVWQQYVLAPWTRDGRISADVVQIAPEVSGTVAEVHVADNQFVQRGDILYLIDPERFQLAVDQAQADVESKRQTMVLQKSTARRRTRLNGVLSEEAIEQASGAAWIASADYQSALVALSLAKLNLARAAVRSPVEGYVTNLRLRPGDYATVGVTKVPILDAQSFWITGYFEETKLGEIKVGDRAMIQVMGFDPIVTGHVESIGRGIADLNDAPNHLGLPNVDPVFTWVRLAQRIPVRIHIDQVPPDVTLAAGMTCSVAVGAGIASDRTRGVLISWLRAVL